jgi:RNA polymerase sigma-70 factor (ECF subfamily)
MTERTLAPVVEEAKGGSQEAFRRIFDILHGRLFSYARGHTKDKASAQDVVQETMIGIWEALPTFEYRSDESFYAFAFMILKRGLMRVYGKAAKSPTSLDAILEELGDRVLPKESPEYEDYRTLTKVLDSISEGSRDVIMLRYWSEMSFAEVAETLGINESAAKVRHHRAMNELRETLSQYGYGKD